MSDMELDEREERESYIKEMTPKERGVYAHMIMRSLRGSWRKPRRRAKILELIAKTGEMKHYDPEELQAKVKKYFEKIGRGHTDGRFWRRYYQDAEIKLTDLTKSRVKDMSGHIPDDMTWDNRRINKVFDDD